MFLVHRFAVLLALSGSIGCSVLVGSELCVTVGDSEDRPLSGAWINVVELVSTKGSASSPATFTGSADSKGKTCFVVPEGTYSVEAGYFGYMNVRYLPVRVFYPNPVHLGFQLPIGDVTEGGGLGADALLSGTLRLNGRSVGGASICVFTEKGNQRVACGLTNALGEYAISVPAGKYRVRIRTALRQEHWTRQECLASEWHWNEISMGDAPENRE